MFDVRSSTDFPCLKTDVYAFFLCVFEQVLVVLIVAFLLRLWPLPSSPSSPHKGDLFNPPPEFAVSCG